MSSAATIDRRSEPRDDASDVIRWKRPGRIEDHKAWTLDKAPHSLGFMTPGSAAPCVGEIINVRHLDHDRWATIDQTVRVVRVTPYDSGGLVTVGCRFE